MRSSTKVTALVLPVRVASKAVDVATTSQSEADQARGREIRQREERLGKLRRDYEKQAKRCNDGNARACGQAESIKAEIAALMPSVPVEPD